MLIHLLLPAAALAWGGMYPATGTQAETGLCEASLAEEGADIVLTLGCMYAGDAVDLGWVIPVPAPPADVQQLTEDPFSELREATRPTWRVEERVEDGCCRSTPEDTGPEEVGEPLAGVDLTGQMWVGDAVVEVFGSDQVAEMELAFTARGWDDGGLHHLAVGAYGIAGWSFVVVTLDPGEPAPEQGRHLPWMQIRYPGDPVWPAAMSRVERADHQRMNVWLQGPLQARLAEPWDEILWEWLSGEPDEDPVAVWERELWKAGGMVPSMALSWSGPWEDGWLTRYDAWVAREACDDDATWVYDAEGEETRTTIVLYEWVQSWMILGGLGLAGALIRRRKR